MFGGLGGLGIGGRDIGLTIMMNALERSARACLRSYDFNSMNSEMWLWTLVKEY